MKNEIEGEILNAFKSDRERGIKILFDHYYRPLVLYARQITDDLQVSEDIVQEFFVRLWSHGYLKNISSGTLKSYLITSVRHSAWIYLKRHDIIRERVQLQGIDISAEVAADMTVQLVVRIKEEISKLPPATSKIVERILLMDKSYKEVAAELNISVNTVKTLQRNGMNILRKRLKGEENLFLFLFFEKNLFQFTLPS